MKKQPRKERAADPARRRFAKSVAAALCAAPLAAAIAKAQTPPATREATAPPKPDATPSPQQTQTPQPSPLAVAYAEVARLRFGDKLSADELTRVTRDLEGNVRTGERLRTAKLENADEPDFVFNA
jgi:type II secretory pathway component HofQ